MPRTVLLTARRRVRVILVPSRSPVLPMWMTTFRRMRPNPEEPPQRVVVLSGLLGDSDRPGWRRLYLSRDLNRYAEFRDEDLVYREAIPAEQPPMRGLESSRVGVRRGARIDFIVSRQGQPLDEFDLDLRIGSRGAGAVPVPNTLPGWCPGGTDDLDCFDTPGCGFATAILTQCGFTCGGNTCYPTCYDTCPQTCDIHHTCVLSQCAATCQTQCGTCNTCPQTCADTCQTCQTECGTCQTQCVCPTEPPVCPHPTGRPNTCPPHCQVP